MTQSGKTVLLMSRLSTRVPIYAMSSVPETRRKVTLFRGVYPIRSRAPVMRSRRCTWPRMSCSNAVRCITARYMVLTIGEPLGKAGGTNTMKIVRVGEHRQP